MDVGNKYSLFIRNRFKAVDGDGTLGHLHLMAPAGQIARPFPVDMQRTVLWGLLLEAADERGNRLLYPLIPRNIGDGDDLSLRIEGVGLRAEGNLCTICLVH
ncbi:hypothetical protein DSECCO2_454380 [anaerobic digester metagenome]